MSSFFKSPTTRYQASVTVGNDPNSWDYRNETTYYLEATDYWEAKRQLEALFPGRWRSLTEAPR